jgi:membrane protease YdiL (CAAX protease family)
MPVTTAPPSAPPSTPRLVTGKFRFATTVAAVVLVLAAVNVLQRFGPPHTGLVLGPVVAVVLVVLARRHGLTWDCLGLSRRGLRKGLAWGTGAVLAVAAVYLVGAVLPLTRPAFHDVRYDLRPGTALLAALVVIPLGTVLLEEVAFRGVLHGLVNRHRGAGWARLSSSTLFGLWHVLPSLRLTRANAAAATIFGAGMAGQVLAVLASVGFTALAGLLLCELRRRSGSLLAAAGLHWATNGLGVVLATALWTLRAV